MRIARMVFHMFFRAIYYIIKIDWYGKHDKYTEEQRKQLIASLVPVSIPPKEPFSDNPFKLLDEMIEERESKKRG